MKVILRQEVEKLGHLGDVVDVRPGYARNFLVPRQQAYPLTPDAEKQIEAERRRLAQREQKRVDELKDLAMSLNGHSVTISAKAQEDTLYGSVGAEEIAAAILKEHKLNVPAAAIVIEEPFKKLGTPDVTIRLAPGAEAVIKVWIVAES